MDTTREIDPQSQHANDSELPLRELFEEWKPELVLADRELRGWVRRYPLASIATVTLVGFVLGRLLRR